MGDLFRFKCWMRQLAAPAKLAEEARLAGRGTLTTETQQRLAQEVLTDEAFRVAPPAPAYRRRLLQALVRAAEEDGSDLADDLVELFTAAQLDDAADPDPSWRYKTFTYVDAAAPGEPAPSPAALEGPPPSPQRQPPGTISLRCTPNLLAASTGAHEWSAGLKMAELCLSRPELFAGKFCAELGCGTGMCGVALARAGACPVLLTDGNETVVENCRCNLELNGVETCSGACAGSEPPNTIQVMQKAWEDDDWSGLSPPDVLLGADLLYDPLIFPVLVPLTARLLARPPKPGVPRPVAYFSAQVRNEASMAEFEAEVVSLGCLQLEVLHFEPAVSFQHLLREEQMADVRVYRIQYDPDAFL